jgi:cytoskeletal protein CcmA (bactofilin family)
MFRAGAGRRRNMFSRDRSTPTPAAKPARGGAPGLSFIGPETVVSGDIATQSQLHVDGRIDGDVKCAQLIQGTGGIIAGNIEADEARLAGTVEGTVTARTLFVEASARILGDVAYETLSIDAGAEIEGRLARRAVPGVDEQPLIATPVGFSPARTGEADSGSMFALSDAKGAARTDG